METLARSGVELLERDVEIVLSNKRGINISGEVLSKELVGIFYGSFLARAVRITKISIKGITIIFSHSFVTNILESIIKSNGRNISLSCRGKEFV